jgi:aspartyl/glutamyl-tRNA(Asn/Gln) amidotransferase C subunit
MKTEKAKPSKILNSCGAVVWRDKGNSQQVLLIKQFEDSTKWSIPKGRKNENEQLEEEQKLEKAFEETLAVVEKLQTVDVGSVEPTFQVTGLENVTREDVVDEQRMFTQEQALANARAQHDGFFVVPQVISQD